MTNTLLIENYIDGEWHRSAATAHADVTNPATAEILARDWRLMPVVRSKFERALARAFPELIVDLPLGPRRQEGAAM